MIPIKQTVLHDPDKGQHGNCFSAVLASLLHLPIDAVPVFSDTKTWVKDLNSWLRPFGLAYLRVGTFDELCASEGISGCHCEVAGTTNRNNDVLHAVVGIDGIPVFDPHPSDDGLKEVLASGIFVMLEPWRVLTPNARHNRPSDSEVRVDGVVGQQEN